VSSGTRSSCPRRSIRRDATARGIWWSSAGGIARGLNAAALEFTGGPDAQSDDYTAVVLKIS
jgi:hypothetical protein